ncbi:hypothetical protein [Arthrobacter sp. fls2-241-R2A-172]|uniref:hypothetical protein n=1 Tax=Arthrobacter sp. fls2-241-R2A-172 TaxID=3040325 RepID=UPI00254EDDE1|nr:hypothetical protein [Arthrobacter sp. fls2-241-R2A-172]
MADHILSTQERNPRSAVLRTVFAVVALVPLLNGVLLATVEALKPYEVYLPAWVFPALNGILVAIAALTALVTRVLAVPGVNDWLRKYLPILAPEDNQ